jgi:hypothetical protein
VGVGRRVLGGGREEGRRVWVDSIVFGRERRDGGGEEGRGRGCGRGVEGVGATDVVVGESYRLQQHFSSAFAI